MSNKEIRLEDSMEHATKNMRHFTRKEVRDEGKLLRAVSHEEKDSERHNIEAETKDAEHVEKDIYKFLFHNIRVMNSLIKIEKDQDFIENKAHIKNDYRAKVSREVIILIRELRRIGVLDKKTE